ncbi:MAG: trehalase family glycosidase [Armatimonadota bacterium]|nr:hypothetical protein [bacterium]
MKLPNVWGNGGQLFAFSGMDGETDVRDQLVGSSLDKGRGFVFHTNPAFEAKITLAKNGHEIDEVNTITDKIIAGDVVSSDMRIDDKNSVQVRWAFKDATTLLIRADANALTEPIEVTMCLNLPKDSFEAHDWALVNDKLVIAGGSNATVNAEDGRISAKLNAAGESTMFALVYGQNVETAARDAMQSDFDEIFRQRIEFYKSLPEPRATDDECMTLAKCASVMKVNCLSPQGMTSLPWTTPDRWPHVHMWIWDSGFHGIGLRHFSQEWAENAIKAVLSRQHENGFIAHLMGVDIESKVIQPPILSWAAWKVYETTGNLEFIRWCYPRLVKMIEFDINERDSDGNGLAGWDDGDASGMDNSPRFDGKVKDAIDLNAFLANEMTYLSRMAELLGENNDWMPRRQGLVDLVNQNLWDQETGFYYDNDPDGSLVKIKTCAGFAPMFAGICTKEQAKCLVDHLMNPEEFWRPFPIASVAADEPTYCDNMWRGPSWINYNYFVIYGLLDYGYTDIAKELCRRTLDEIVRWYKEDGLTYEYYDAEQSVSPVMLHRKKTGGPEARRSNAMATLICDYNWTASLYIDLLLNRIDL